MHEPDPPAQAASAAQRTRTSGWQDLAVDVARCLRFYSRLPVPALPFEADPHALPDFGRMTRALPIAGAILGTCGAAMLWAALAAGLGAPLSAALVVAFATLITGAFHEDGLADTFDAFGGGATRERRLEIMKDSRIGAFGAAALILGLALRILALATLIERLGPLAAGAAWIWIAALSRTAGLMPLALLAPARLDGASAAVGRPSLAAHLQAWALTVLFAMALALGGVLDLAGLALAFALTAAGAWLMTRWSQRAIGGQTGDVAGAVQQMAEIAALLGLLIAAPQ